MSQPGIVEFTTRVSRRRTLPKAALLDTDNSNIVSIGTKDQKKALSSPSSPRKTLKAPPQPNSPAKITNPIKDEVRN